LIAAGCGGSAAREAAAPTSTVQAPTAKQPTTQSSTAAEAKPKSIPGVPRYAWPYRSWTRLNQKPVPPRDSDPHLGTKEVYASRKADGTTYLPGTIIVKEATRPGADFIGLIAVMRKVRGADQAHKDWVFTEYTRGSAHASFAETASGDVCWSCHMEAAQTDYVWIAKLGLTR
jgi:hypothetical protein